MSKIAVDDSHRSTRYPVLIQKRLVDCPGRVFDDLVDPFAVIDGLVAFLVSKDSLALFRVRQFVVAHYLSVSKECVYTRAKDTPPTISVTFGNIFFACSSARACPFTTLGVSFQEHKV